ncbi:MAG: DUF2752 domain-containing protein [Coprobacter sp.]|nr:DUF2752 domain-containing protein [Coprobacter sp.]
MPQKKFYKIWLVSYLLILLWVTYQFFSPEGIFIQCPSKLLYGIPCPGCGTTRACLMLIHGEFLNAMMMNPNCLLAMIYIGLTPILFLIDVTTKRASLYMIYLWIETKLHNKVLGTILCIEIAIAIRNMIMGI